MDFNSDKRKVDANYNDVPEFQMIQMGLLRESSPDFGHDPESMSICPLLTPSPTTVKFESVDPLSKTMQENMLLEVKSLSPDFNHDEETALLSASPSVSYGHPLDPLRNLERQSKPPTLDIEMTGISSQPSELPQMNYRELESENLENTAESFHNRRNSIFNSDQLESSGSSCSFALNENISSAQLLENLYQKLDGNKVSEAPGFISQQDNVKAAPIDLSSCKTPPDYCFISWNWPLIRKSCFWSIASIIMAIFCVVVGLLATIPPKCHPPHKWYQGTVFYEIFPASFQDSNHDGIGDLRGIASRVDYISKLGITAVRLNSIFAANHYPENFGKVTSLIDIEKSLGDLKDFKYLLSIMKEKNISMILDLPIYPLVKSLGETKMSVTRKNAAEKMTNVIHNHRLHRSSENDSIFSSGLLKTEFNGKKMYLKPYIDGGIAGLMKSTSDHLNSMRQSVVEEAMEFWLQNGVDGVYLKGLEHYVNDPKFLLELKKWKDIKGSFEKTGRSKMLMCDYRILSSIDDEQTLETLLSTMDLLDVYLDVSNGTSHIKTEVSNCQERKLAEKKEYPWIHWNIGNIGTKRLASRVENNFGAILFQFLLPGTISIFYGDEIGLTEIHDPHLDHNDLKNIHQLAPMKWQPNGTGFTRPERLPWIPFAKSVRTNDIHEKIISNMSWIRSTAPSIYMNSIRKEEESFSNHAFRFSDENIIVLERTYPRRDAYVVVYNAGSDEALNDLSSIYYGGTLLEDSKGRSGIYVNFNNIKLGSGEAFIVKLDK